MAVSVTKRPIGVKLGACVSATIDEDYTGYATVNKTSHGLTDGDWVYVSSNVENYNGFWPVDVIDGHHFFLLQYPGGPRVAYIADATITYCPEESTHGWSCVHLPIIYQLSNTKWPTNSEDTARTVSSFTDDNGYVNLNLSGALKATVYALDYVKISGATNEALNGVFQIITAVSSSDVTIDLVYDSGYSFAGATVQFYYNSYHLKVKVYGGLPASHPWVAEKPYEVLTTLKFIPDTDNKATFSINEILKAQITTRNNPLLGTLPNNLDFFTGFYISYAEGYDTSDGTDITAYTGSYTSDNDASWSVQAIDALDLWLETGTGAEWTDTTTPVVQLVDTQGSEFKYTVFALDEGATYRINYSVTVSGVSGSSSISCFFAMSIRSAAGVALETNSVKVNRNSTGTGTWEFTAPAGAARIYLYASQITGFLSSTNDLQVNSITLEKDSSSAFSGFAANAKLPFKNQHSGFLTDYIGGSWLTLFTSPVISDNYFDLSAIIDTTGDVDVLIDGVINTTITAQGQGVYRIPITYTGSNMTVKLQSSGVDITDEITLTAETECSNQSLYLTWLNYLGGFDYWNFTAQKEYNVSVGDVQTLKTNIFPNWPNSYGSFADTITKETMRESKNQIVVRSQYLTLAQLQAIKHIRTSPVVQIVTSRQDRRTVLVDNESFRVYDDADKLYSISFTITYTDDIPSQSV